MSDRAPCVRSPSVRHREPSRRSGAGFAHGTAPSATIWDSANLDFLINPPWGHEKSLTYAVSNRGKLTRPQLDDWAFFHEHTPLTEPWLLLWWLGGTWRRPRSCCWRRGPSMRMTLCHTAPRSCRVTSASSLRISVAQKPEFATSYTTQRASSETRCWTAVTHGRARMVLVESVHSKMMVGLAAEGTERPARIKVLRRLVV